MRGILGRKVKHRQPAKTINAPYQKWMRSELRRKKLAEAHQNAVVACTTINDILARNKKVEQNIIAKIKGDDVSLDDATVDILLQ